MNEQFTAKIALTTDGQVEKVVAGSCSAEQASAVADALISLALRIREAITKP